LTLFYHERTQAALYCPTGCDAKTIRGLIEGCPPFYPVRSYLLIRDPVDRLKTLYYRANTPISFKWWFKAYIPEPQLVTLPNPDETIRYEYFERDLNSVGMRATIDKNSPPEVDICMATMANIRRVYYNDFLAGDYL